MGFAFSLAQRVNGRPRDDIPDEALSSVKLAIADTIGVAVAGVSEPPVGKLRRALGGVSSGACLLIGTAERVTPEIAVPLNAVAAHALDFDDSSQVSGTHPSATLLPVLLALAEDRGASGLALIDAYVAGFDTMTRLGHAVMPAHYERGWHPTSTLGVFGAAAAAARLLGLDDERLAAALSIAVSLSAGVKSNFGTETKPMHAAFASRSGLLAARLAAEGLTASADAFEHRQGFFEVFHGAGICVPEAALHDRPLVQDFREPGMAIKQHPCCGSTHSIVDAALKMRSRQGPISGEDVAGIETSTHASRLAHTNRPDPRTATDAKFSVQYVAARAVVDGPILLRHFSDGAFREPDIWALTSKVVAVSHQGADPFLATLTVTLKNGDVLSESASTRFGRDPANPFSAAEFYGKFEDCLRQTFPDGDVRGLFEILMALERVPSMDELTRPLEAIAAVPRASA